MPPPASSPVLQQRPHYQKTFPRSDDMLIVKGVNVFPSQIETVLLNQGYPANYQIIVGRKNNSDTIEVQVEMTQEMFSDNAKALSSLHAYARRNISHG